MMSSAAVLLKTSRASRKRFRARAKTVRLPVGIAVRLQPGIPFVFTPESFSRSPRNPFRLAPESATASLFRILGLNRPDKVPFGVVEINARADGGYVKLGHHDLAAVDFDRPNSLINVPKADGAFE